MLRQSKFTQHAIAAVSRLAEVFDESHAWLSAADLAAARNLRKPAAAKVLSVLAQEGIVVGFPGPGGGYRLARRPSEISLWDVAGIFDREREVGCPYGPGWCGNNHPCPLHHSLEAMQKVVESYMRATTFDVFARHAPAVPPHRADRLGGRNRSKRPLRSTT